jgi:hypothetical protein
MEYTQGGTKMTSPRVAANHLVVADGRENTDGLAVVAGEAKAVVEMLVRVAPDPVLVLVLVLRACPTVAKSSARRPG